MTYKNLLLEAAIIYRLKTKRLSGYVRSLLPSPYFARGYAIAALTVLLITILYWSILGAKTQLNNADALVDPYLFKTLATFHGANFPGQHTQLLKWPLFLIIKLFGFSSSSYIALTVAIVLLTIMVLVFILYRIERRLLVFGTLCLALASVLLLIPTQPYAGGILPVNMAMLTTRNVEYVFYLIALILVARTTRLTSWSFWLATTCMVLLLASDKLFLAIGLGAALFSLIIYALARQWELVNLSAYWVSAQAIAAVGAVALLNLIDASHLTHIANQTATSPYSLVTSYHNIVLSSVYALLGIFTNLGANPAFDATVLRTYPYVAASRLASIWGLAFVVNLLVAAMAIYAAVCLLRLSVNHKPTSHVRISTATRLSLMLIWTTLVTIGAFVISNHYGAVDSRYLTIVLFALFIASATLSRQRLRRVERLVGAGAICVLAIALGLVAAQHISNNELAAFAPIEQRDARIVAIIGHHPTSTLVGDYWRVVPINFEAHSSTTIVPLANCTTPRTELSSSVWQPDLRTHSFTYLLSYDQKLTDYPSCSLQQVISVFGRPNASALIVGTPDNPKEQLLFYDRGIYKSSTTTPQPARGPSTILPITLDQLPYISCPVPSIMPIVAHEDDDLLFMSPDVLHAIKAGYCVRTVYITAGSAGLDQFYWLGRERGSEAAYTEMIGDNNTTWVQRIVKLANNEFAVVANPRGNSKISLIFLHLPDGNLGGQGFSISNSESLAKLYAHQIRTIHSVDGQSNYTADQLVSAINALLTVYGPTEIYTQSTYVGKQYPDHSDHTAVGQFTKLAYSQYETEQYNNLIIVPIKFYLGYPVRQMPINVSDGDAQAIESAFLTYAKYDSAVCHTQAICQQTPTYHAYLTRQYQWPY